MVRSGPVQRSSAEPAEGRRLVMFSEEREAHWRTGSEGCDAAAGRQPPCHRALRGHWRREQKYAALPSLHYRYTRICSRVLRELLPECSLVVRHMSSIFDGGIVSHP